MPSFAGETLTRLAALGPLSRGEAVNLSILTVFDMSQIKGLRPEKTAKVEFFHKLGAGEGTIPRC